MIVYASTKSAFVQDVYSNRIADKILTLFKRRLGHSAARSEVNSWQNSMRCMHTLLMHSSVPEDAGVAIEYNIPQTSKRVDFILTGRNEADRDTAVIIELKQWSEVVLSEKDGIVETFLQGRLVETGHPSFQAWSYAALLEDFNETVRKDHIELVPCAYLHNCQSPHVINAPFYREHTRNAPSFLKGDVEKLKSFIERYVRKGDRGELIYRIDQGKIKPSKSLADALIGMMKGKREFLLVDDQKLVYETALALADKAEKQKKQVLIVDGGPGTGKSVVAINLLVELIHREKVAHYVTKNGAPRQVYRSKLTGSFTRSRIDNLFKSSAAYYTCEPDSFDVLVVDEAHRLNEKSGLYQNQGENQTGEIIRAAKLGIFFIDEDQRVTWKDTGKKSEIRRWAQQCGADVTELALASQFRCNGSDGYLAWLDHTLQIRETANWSIDELGYDFRVFDNPNALRQAINERNRESNKARMVAGYCWDWISRKDPSQLDVSIPEHDFRMRWNLNSDGGLWILKPNSVREIGCIHTCQGLDLDYIGVIIGPDLTVRGGRIHTDATKRSRMDSSVKGYKAALKQDPDVARAKAAAIIKNTYRTLMTRGQKGCYIFCTDPETNEFFKESLGAGNVSGGEEEEENLSPLRVLDPDEVRPFENAVPLLNLQVAAGDFSPEQWFSGCEWVALPEPFVARPDYFVARVVGESMNRRIPNGSWCLFRKDQGGTRDGKVVLVRHRHVQDPEYGRYTVKVYHSEKTVSEDAWQHQRIILRPDTSASGYHEIILEQDEAEDWRVLGELVAILG